MITKNINLEEIDLQFKAGVYLIYSCQGGEFTPLYVGSTTNLGHRLTQHNHNLKYQLYKNKVMQTYYDDGWELKFSVLEFCKEEDLAELEEKYINEYNPPDNTKNVTWIIKDYSKTNYKLTKDDVHAIRNMYVSEDVTMREIADKFNITIAYVNEILKYRRWRYV